MPNAASFTHPFAGSCVQSSLVRGSSSTKNPDLLTFGVWWPQNKTVTNRSLHRSGLICGLSMIKPPNLTKSQCRFLYLRVTPGCIQHETAVPFRLILLSFGQTYVVRNAGAAGWPSRITRRSVEEVFGLRDNAESVSHEVHFRQDPVFSHERCQDLQRQLLAHRVR